MPNIDVGYIILFFVVFVFSLSVHESAHAYVSNMFGDDLGRSLGRITLNPLPHIDPFGTILFPLIGLISGGFMFGWAKPVPVNPNAWREKNKANFWVSAAGPLSNLVLAITFFVILKVLIVSGVMGMGGTGDIWDPISKILLIGIFLNITLFIFNLLPIPPLDGSGVLESFLPYEAQRGFDQIKPYGFIILVALMMTPVFGWVLRPIQFFVMRLLQA